MDTVAVGIDFGTTTSSIAVWQNEKVEVIANDQGDRTCPTYVAYTNTERLVGDVAVHQIVVNPNNTVFDAKRFIGRKSDDKKLQEDMKYWPFKVIDSEKKIKIEVEHQGEVKRFTPEEISSVVFSQLKDTAEAYLGTEVRDAVISVPTQFNNAQRQAIIDAGKIAGFNVLRIIDEPTAAALAYCLNHDIKGERRILFFDVGGGTCDASLLTITEGSSVEVKATAGNAHHGGVDFDIRLANYLIEECKRRFQTDLRTDTSAVRLLRDAAQKAKCALSTNVEAIIDIAGLTDEIDFLTTISRSRFERICADLYRSALLPVEQLLTDSKIDKASIDEIVLVGGSTTMPMIQFLLRKLFNGRPLDLWDLKEPIAYGAAVHAAMLAGDSTPIIKSLSLIDITGMTIGYETHGCVMTNLIEKNTIKPCKKTQMYTTHADNQDVVPIDVYEGERVVTKFNNFLGTFKISEISPDTRGKPQIEVSFDIDANGILLVSAKEVRTKNVRDLVVTDDTCRLTQPEIDQMIVEEQMYRVQDQDRRENAVVRNYFHAYMYKTKQSALRAGTKISEPEKIVIVGSCDSELKWLEDNPEPSKEECYDKLDDFKRVHCEIMTKMHATGDASPTVEDY